LVEFLENKSLRLKTIDSYGEGGFRIQGEVYFGNLFLFEEHLQIWDSISEITSFLSNCKNLDLLIFGTGSQLSTSDIHFLEISKYLSFGANIITGKPSSINARGPCFISPAGYPSACK